MRDPTPEQQSIITFARTRGENLIVNALAGTGKTTTIEMICNAVSGIPILYLAFNKRIVDEATKRMPSHVECRTQNSLGHRVWGQACGRRLVVASDKMRVILKNIIGELPRNAQGEAWEDFSDTLKWLQRAKRDGVVPRRWNGPHIEVMSPWEFFARYDEEPTAQQQELMAEALNRSITAAYEGGIDYDDQIYMPVCFGGPWPKFPLVIIDEAQDCRHSTTRC
jgi:superfamily I DNA/RNA helicase